MNSTHSQLNFGNHILTLYAAEPRPLTPTHTHTHTPHSSATVPHPLTPTGPLTPLLCGWVPPGSKDSTTTEAEAAATEETAKATTSGEESAETATLHELAI